MALTLNYFITELDSINCHTIVDETIYIGSITPFGVTCDEFVGKLASRHLRYVYTNEGIAVKKNGSTIIVLFKSEKVVAFPSKNIQKVVVFHAGDTFFISDNKVHEDLKFAFNKKHGNNMLRALSYGNSLQKFVQDAGFEFTLEFFNTAFHLGDFEIEQKRGDENTWYIIYKKNNIFRSPMMPENPNTVVEPAPVVSTFSNSFLFSGGLDPPPPIRPRGFANLNTFH